MLEPCLGEAKQMTWLNKSAMWGLQEWMFEEFHLEAFLNCFPTHAHESGYYHNVTIGEDDMRGGM